MKSLVPGMSKLMYALHLTASLWGLNEYTAQDLNKITCPKQTMNKLQSCRIQAVALLAPDLTLTPDLTTAELLKHTGILSVHQQAALQIASLALRMIE